MRAFRLAYDGRPFHGFQRQPDVPTVEGTLFSALCALDVLDPEAAKPAGYAAAGRTDAGVSALAQTVAFATPEWLTPRALNAELPGTMRAWAHADVDADFHATHDAVRRTYVYHLYAPRATTADSQGPSRSLPLDRESTRPTLDGRPTVDDDRAADALAALCGRHDFHNLTPDSRGTERSLAGRIERQGDFLVVEVAAAGFARQLVRRLVAVIRAVAAGEQPRAWIDDLLGADPVDPRPAPAAPEPLVLADVRYPGVDFARDPAAADSAAVAFGERAVAARTADRVSTAIVDGIDRDRGGRRRPE